jgi:hypothetical protein
MFTDDVKKIILKKRKKAHKAVCDFDLNEDFERKTMDVPVCHPGKLYQYYLWRMSSRAQFGRMHASM